MVGDEKTEPVNDWEKETSIYFEHPSGGRGRFAKNIFAVKVVKAKNGFNADDD